MFPCAASFVLFMFPCAASLGFGFEVLFPCAASVSVSLLGICSAATLEKIVY